MLSQSTESFHGVPSAWNAFPPFFGLDQCGPIAHSVMAMGKFSICSVQCGSLQPLVATNSCSVPSVSSTARWGKWLPYWAVGIHTTTHFEILSSGLRFSTVKPSQLHSCCRCPSLTFLLHPCSASIPIIRTLYSR